MVLYCCISLLSNLEASNILFDSSLYFLEDSSSFFCISLSLIHMLFFIKKKKNKLCRVN